MAQLVGGDGSAGADADRKKGMMIGRGAGNQSVS